MNIDDYNNLKHILQEFYGELEELDAKIDYSKRCVKETEAFARSITLSDSQYEDLKVFSPRLCDDEVRKIYSEKEKYEKVCQELERKREILVERMDNIKEILKYKNYNLTVLTVQEEDRQRIARDLHDTSVQNLAHLIHKIELCSLYIDKDPVQAKLELSLVNKCLKDTIDEIRNIIFNLRPMTFDDLGLKAAFERLIDSINENKKYKVILDIDEVSCENNLILVSIYRVVQESLINIVKHADGTEIYFSCKSVDGFCIITIRDNGKGFDMSNGRAEKHFGLSLMKERVKLLHGKMNMSSQLGEGTEIYMKIPLEIYTN